MVGRWENRARGRLIFGLGKRLRQGVCVKNPEAKISQETEGVGSFLEGELEGGIEGFWVLVSDGSCWL